MAALLFSEAQVVSFESKSNLFACTLDARKAFDVVQHSLLFPKVLSEGTDPETVHLIKEMYTGMHGRVKWKGTISNSFSISQGVKQGRGAW